MHSGDGEFLLGHGLLEFKYSLFGIAIDKSLVDIEIGIEV
jgi:hypothetical protein